SKTAELRTLEEVDMLCGELRRPADGPRLFVLKITAENLPRSLPPRDAVEVKNRFRAHLGFATC
ncbi:MAG: aldehyde dehydrogenase, partial [Mesorhizobium sp.]